MNNDAIEAAWKELKAPQYETVTSRWYFKKGYEAATKAALGSRVVLPERKTECEDIYDPDSNFDMGFNECLDQIKLIPLTAEQVDSLLPNRNDIYLMWLERKNAEGSVLHPVSFESLLEFNNFIRESIKKRLGGM